MGRPGSNGRPHGPPPGLTPLALSPAGAANAGRTRPVYPYPCMAVYSGQGDARQAGVYRRVELRDAGYVTHRMGSDLFTPYAFKPL
ncbi:hypothetical protein AO073_15230 [Pseudomonas syringae ICMP 11293]|uniref:tannase/feruloyl esterase family alpha/beta hydrolase n=1 Tax=Pseudomonas syringae TaxID=317 RepID=UPI000731AD90|nr:tannase/feruloyl esterase family alpha/beta hydrolase [Pseudomonas syringae]KTB95202.1 hypothetical protein AO073_15230 [Pseudomonas syringae ICMP 11293]